MLRSPRWRSLRSVVRTSFMSASTARGRRDTPSVRAASDLRASVVLPAEEALELGHRGIADRGDRLARFLAQLGHQQQAAPAHRAARGWAGASPKQGHALDLDVRMGEQHAEPSARVRYRPSRPAARAASSRSSREPDFRRASIHSGVSASGASVRSVEQHVDDVLPERIGSSPSRRRRAKTVRSGPAREEVPDRRAAEALVRLD